MTTIDLPPWSPAAIEKEVASLLARTGVSCRVPVERIIQSECDATIATTFGIARFGVEAIVCRARMGYRRKYVIKIDQGIADAWSGARYRIAIAEEAGHLVLHKPVVNGVHNTEDFIDVHRRSDWHRIESEARQFGRALCLRPTVLQHICEIGYPATVDSLGFSQPQRVLHVLQELIASECEVPYEEVEIRLQEMDGDLLRNILGSVLLRSTSLLSSIPFASESEMTQEPVTRRDKENLRQFEFEFEAEEMPMKQ